MKKVLLIALAAFFMVSLISINLSAEEISWKDAKNYIGKEVTVCGKIVDGFPIGGGLFLLGMGVSAMQPATVGLEVPDAVKSKLPADWYKGKEICVTGKPHVNPLGGASLTISDPSQIVEK